ncbi:mitochondrial chaperone BCS1 [Rhodocollybia butyracea]|uniref:Mitochondrial chaperone BCS1 n=1 Tax=Rhodocollybia butyracea TaxID=206335 RepID=A0A9P5UCH8_9AGAR|nr:mitochondrial chaperone BCS1 [Rhodocollybia butyracea]
MVNDNPTAVIFENSDNAIRSLPPNSKNWFEGLLGMDNPYFQAGFGLMGVGVALGALRKFASFSEVFLRRRLLVQVEINNKDRAYPWFLSWMANQSQHGPKSGSILSSISKSHRLSLETTVEQHHNESSSVFFNLVAGTGMHWFNYRGVWMQVLRERDTRSLQLMSGTPWETITLTTLSRDRQIFPLLFTEAKDLALKDQEGKLVIQTPWGTEWRPFGVPRRKRPLRSVVLDEGVGEGIERDVGEFLGRRKWYVDRGIPYRRGYLFHGPPGSGKSSYIQALAGSLNYNLCLLNLSERGLGDDKLTFLLSTVPERSFVLIEDVDAAFNKRVQTSEDGYQSSVTFSGFLNALDGVASGEERIVFLTTNHLERLDPALIRPGRVDFIQYVGDATPNQAKKLFERFYVYGSGDGDNVDPLRSIEFTHTQNRQSELELLAQTLHDLLEDNLKKGKSMSMAALQGLFIRNQGVNGAEEAVNEVRGVFGAAEKTAKST